MREDIQEKIIVTASELFYSNGYNSTGINEIIDKAGIAKATLYNHFKSKDELCISYLKHMNADFLMKVETFCSAKPKGNTQVLGLFDFLQEFFLDNKFNGCWCIKTLAELPKNNKLIRKEIQVQKEQFIQFISDLVQTNLKLKSKKQIATKARQIYLLYEGAVGESHLHQKAWPIVEAKSICSKIV